MVQRPITISLLRRKLINNPLALGGSAGAPASGPSVGDGMLLEDDTSFLLLEDESFLLLE
jgi:hypothetical protein